MEDNEETIKVKCVLDGFETTLIKKAAERSVLLKDLLINYQADKIFEVQNVNKEAMEKMKEYLEHYKDVEPKEIKKPLKGSKFSECVEEWDNTFIGNEDNIEKYGALETEKRFLQDRLEILEESKNLPVFMLSF